MKSALCQDVVTQLGLGLTHLHTEFKLAHCDVKGENIFVRMEMDQCPA